MSKRTLLLAIVLLLVVSILPANALTPEPIVLIPTDSPLTLDANNQNLHWDEVWDVTQGDVTMTFTLDMSGIIQPDEWLVWIESPPGSGNWSQVLSTDPTKYPDSYTPWVEVGMRGVGGDDYNPGPAYTYQGKCGGWLVAESDDWLGARDENGDLINDGIGAQDGDDKLSLAATSGVGEWHYDVEDGDGVFGYDAGWDTVLPMFGSHDNHGLWYDRDTVDPWQVNSWENSGINAGRINTGGIYHVELRYHAIDAGMGVVFAKINGVMQGFYKPSWHGGGMGEIDRYPAGLSFKGDMKQMQVFAGSFAYDPAGHDYGSVQLSDLQVTGVPGVANPLVPAFTATVGAGNAVSFDASATAGGMGPYTYLWDWNNDGTVDETTTNPVVTHTFADPGVYNVKLTVDPYRCKAYSVTHEVDTVPPKANLAIVKSGPVWANMGADLTYTYDVTNAGPASATPTLSDDKCGVPTYDGGDTNNNGLVDTDETWKFTCTYTPAVTPYMVLKNTVTVTPVGVEDSDLSDNTDTYTLVWTVLRKDVLLYWQGHNVGYSDPNTEFTFEMYKGDELLGTFTIKESAPVYLWLSEGTYYFNEVDVPLGYTPAREGWSLIVTTADRMDMSFENLIRFDLAVDKTGPTQCVAPDGTITYNYKLTNTGPAAVTPILTDDNATPNDPADDYHPTYVSGDINGDGKIQFDETWYYTATYHVPNVPVGSKVVNIVTVKDAEDDYGTGWKSGGDTNLINNTDSYSVCVSWYGFTPGYWKNHPKQWPKFSITNHDQQIVAVEKTTPVMSVFDVPDSLLKCKTAARTGVTTCMLDLNKDGKNDTLIQALAYKGGSDLAGKAQILLRAATAALLNEAALGDYFLPYGSVAELIAAINTTLATEDLTQYTTMAAYLDYWNNGLHKFP